MFTLSKLGEEGAIVLPVAPSGYEVTTAQNNVTVNINSVGEILLRGKKQLKKMSFSSIFPKQHYSFCDATPLAPYEYINTLEKWENNAEPLNIVIDDALSMTCLIESFNYGENDGTGDVNYTLSLVYYEPTAGTRASQKIKQKKYTCKKGDTFYSVARKCTGSTANAKKIAKYNKMKVNAKLKKGKKLVIKI
ncbi:MAG: LysM peptidoglycan-binding domain-containing protein [Lachnospiraceae bacterium]